MKRRLLVLLALAAAATGTVFAVATARRPGAVLFQGGPVFTMDGQDRVVEALAVEMGRIVGAGSEADWRGWAEERGARTVDLDGHALLPGFVDAHSHFPSSGVFAIATDLQSPPVGSVQDIDELVARLRARAEGQGAGEWVFGFGYDDTLLAERRHPTRQDLDGVSGRHPVGILHVSGHLGVVNSAGLERLGISRATPDPVGGRIRRDPEGEPDGVLEESALQPMEALFLSPSWIDAWRITRHAIAEYLAAGVTTAQNGYATPREMQALAWLARLRLLPLRVVVWPSAETADTMRTGSWRFASPDPERLRVGAVKLIADGSIQGYTGYLSEPYHVPPGGDPQYRGYPRIPGETLRRRVAEFHAAGWQVAVHGNGDASIDDILDAFEAAQRERPRPDARFVVVHAQMAREDQLDRMPALGVIPSFFVLHVLYWGDRHRDLFMGPERAARISPTRSAAERGLHFTLHADSPVVPMEPLRIVWSAVNRRTASGTELGAAQRIDVMRALRAVTIDAARQHFQDAETGSLEPGKLADLVVLDRSPLRDPATIDRIRVLETIVGGRTVWRAAQ